MSEMSVILQNANESSLIVIDELARSTSTEEGIGISYALCEELIASRAYVFFATHFLNLALLELNYPVVRNFHLSFDVSCGADESEEESDVRILKTSHVLYKGRYKGPLYGLELAELTTLPESVTLRARALAERLRAKTMGDISESSHDASSTAASDEPTGTVRRKRLACIAQRLIDLSRVAGSMSDASLSTHLRQLQLADISDELF